MCASSAEPQAGHVSGTLLAVPAVVAVQASVAVQGQRDVAVPAATREAAGTAVDRRRHAAPVEQQDRLAAAVPRPGRARSAAARRAGSRSRGGGRRSGPGASAPRSGPRARPARAWPSSRAAAWRSRRRRRRLRGQRASRRRCGRRSGDRTPACTRRRAPRRRSRGRDRASARRSPTARRRRPCASPRAMRSRSSRRSACPRAEWRIATVSPNRSRNLPTVCGASAISGTSTIVPRPRASAASHAWRYTSVLPLPVGPTSRRCAPAVSSRPVDDAGDRDAPAPA